MRLAVRTTRSSAAPLARTGSVHHPSADNPPLPLSPLLLGPPPRCSYPPRTAWSASLLHCRLPPQTIFPGLRWSSLSRLLFLLPVSLDSPATAFALPCVLAPAHPPAASCPATP